MTYEHATDQLPYVIENVDTGEELAAAETFDAAAIGAEVLRREERANVGVRYRPERACPSRGHCTCVGHSVTICCYCGGDRRAA